MAAELLELRELKRVVDAIFDHMLNELKIENVTITNEKDFYWDVPSDGLFEVKGSQPQLDVGRLVDDWEFLRSILRDKDNAVALMLIHVAPLLRRVGEEIGQ